MDKGEQQMTVGDVAHLAERSVETIRSAIKAGRLAATRTPGGIRLVKRQDAVAYAAQLRARKEKGQQS